MLFYWNNNLENQRHLKHSWSDKSLKGTIVHRTCHSTIAGLLEIMSPLLKQIVK